MKADNTDKNQYYLYEDITEKIIGAAFSVYNRLGYGYREKEY